MPYATDTFLIYRTKDFTAEHAADAFVCISEEQARDIVAGCFHKPSDATVFRVTEGELARNVSADFVEDELEDYADHASSRADRIHQMQKEGVL